jgi:hypothetical protein
MRSIAIQQALERQIDRAGIGSFAGLRAAYQSELEAHRTEIEAKAVAHVALIRQIVARARVQMFPCTVCGGPIPNIKRASRRYCSDRCRQRARRSVGTTGTPPPRAL